MSSYIVICSACSAGNRIPEEMEGKSGRCGSCRATLAPLYLHPQPLTGTNFDGFIASYPGPVLAEFWAPW
jgi:thioredoxin 2